MMKPYVDFERKNAFSSQWFLRTLKSSPISSRLSVADVYRNCFAAEDSCRRMRSCVTETSRSYRHSLSLLSAKVLLVFFIRSKYSSRHRDELVKFMYFTPQSKSSGDPSRKEEISREIFLASFSSYLARKSFFRPLTSSLEPSSWLNEFSGRLKVVESTNFCEITRMALEALDFTGQYNFREFHSSILSNIRSHRLSELLQPVIQ